VSGTNLPAPADVGFLLAKASTHVNDLLVAEFAAAGFPEVRPSYGSVLVPLFERDGMRIGELAAVARLSKQAMTTTVALCERDGLVQRERDPRDGRAFVVRLSERGRRFRDIAERVLDELDRRLQDTLGSHDRDALVRALKGVLEL
jgi:DNA-binding MarR family transcriptional regulator